MYFFTFVIARGIKAVTTSKNRIWPNKYIIYKKETKITTSNNQQGRTVMFKL